MGAGTVLAVALSGPWAMPALPADPLGDIETRAALARIEQVYAAPPPECDRGAGGDDAIVVCGRGARFERMVLPPLPGARRHLIAGEPPSAAGALGPSCIGLCGRGVGITVNPIALLRDPVAELKRALHIER